MSIRHFCALLFIHLSHLTDTQAQDFIFPLNDGLKDIEGITRAIVESKFDSSLFLGGKFTNLEGCPSSNSRILRIKNGKVIPFAQFLSGSGAIVYDIIEADSKLYFAGNFSGVLDNVKFQNIAMWDGKKWSNLGGGLNNDVFDLKYDAKNGRIYAGGRFSDVGGDKDADLIAYWDNTSWKKVEGDKQIGNTGVVYNIEVASNGNLYVGGSISVYDSLNKYVAEAIIVWDGKMWKGLVGECANMGPGSLVRNIKEINGRLYITGNFSFGCGNDRHRQNVIYYNGKDFIDVGDRIELNYVNVITERNGSIYVGGEFRKTGGSDKIRYIAKLEGNKWSKVIDSLGGDIFALTSVNDNLLIGGSFNNINNIDGLNAIVAFGRPLLISKEIYKKSNVAKFIDSLILFTPKKESLCHYHKYEVSTEICRIDSSKCTLRDIYNKWLSDIRFQVPLRRDFKGTTLTGIIVDISPKSTIDYSDRLPIQDNTIHTIGQMWERLAIAIFTKTVGSFECIDRKTLNFIDDKVLVSVDNDNMCITNYTLPGHFLYPGKIQRCLKVSNCNRISMVTTGEGFHFCGDNTFGCAFSDLNKKIGISAFNNVDKRFKEFITK